MSIQQSIQKSTCLVVGVLAAFFLTNCKHAGKKSDEGSVVKGSPQSVEATESPVALYNCNGSFVDSTDHLVIFLAKDRNDIAVHLEINSNADYDFSVKRVILQGQPERDNFQKLTIMGLPGATPDTNQSVGAFALRVYNSDSSEATGVYVAKGEIRLSEQASRQFNGTCNVPGNAAANSNSDSDNNPIQTITRPETDNEYQVLRKRTSVATVKETFSQQFPIGIISGQPNPDFHGIGVKCYDAAGKNCAIRLSFSDQATWEAFEESVSHSEKMFKYYGEWYFTSAPLAGGQMPVAVIVVQEYIGRPFAN